MKNLILLLSVFSVLALGFISCGKDSTNEIQVLTTENVSVSGQISIPTSTVQEGGSLALCIDNLSGLETLAQKGLLGRSEYSLQVVYLLDGDSIASSTSISGKFAVNYQLKDVAAGEHTITARINAGKLLKVENQIRQTTINVERNPIDLTLDLRSYLTSDLMNFVTPILTYQDVDGSHQIELKKDMYTEDSTEKNGVTFKYYNWEDKINVKCGALTKIEMRYKPKDGITFDDSKKYWISENFSIRGYNYKYNKVLHVGVIIDVIINIGINLGLGEETMPSDGMLTADQAKAYINQIADKVIELNVTIDNAGDLFINDKKR